MGKSMRHLETRRLFEPATDPLRFLPEGPYRCPDGRISWVAIQHGPTATVGSLNLLDLNAGTNTNILLDGRPGFAFPTSQDAVFLVGLERRLAFVNTENNEVEILLTDIDHEVDGTIINDALTFDGHLVFGCKDLKFAEKKAGLYLLRAGDSQAIKLSGEQVCSNGKAVVKTGASHYTLYDICSHSQQVLAWQLDVDRGTITNSQIIVDLTAEEVFPDGMIMTPDQAHLIIAIYDPRNVTDGVARMYEIDSGKLVAVWHCDRSPRVTCPQLIELDGAIQLLLTTADEGMSPELRAKCPNAGCLFAGPTDFTQLNEAPVFPLSGSA